MAVIVVTGATGFIGAAFVAAARKAGHDVLPLGRRPVGDATVWRLDEPLPESCARADAIVHLASAALQETENLKAAAERDIDGTWLILEQSRAWRSRGHAQRFVFVSSQSAGEKAVNHYGRSKWRIENLLDGPHEIIVRPGFVYSDPPASVFEAFHKMARAPFVPIISRRPAIQPIHVDELSEGLVRLSTMSSPPQVANLGAAEPLTFQQAIAAVARSQGRRPPIGIPLPAGPVRIAANLVDRVLGSTFTERIDGLVGLEPFEARRSLDAIGLDLRAFSPAAQP